MSLLELLTIGGGVTRAPHRVSAGALVMSALALGLMVACGAAQPVNEPPPLVESRAEEPVDLDRPESDEDRAQATLNELMDYCANRRSECGAYADPAHHRGEDVSPNSRQHLDESRRQLGVLGVTLRWDDDEGEFHVVGDTTIGVSGEPSADP